MKRRHLRPQFALVAILALSVFLNLYRLDRVGINGIGNPYYAAAVRSMLTRAHSFFYLSVELAGFVLLDKPPLAFWIQAASAGVFGFHGLSLLLPEAMAGTGADALWTVWRVGGDRLSCLGDSVTICVAHRTIE